MPAIAEDMSKETEVGDEIQNGFVLRGFYRAFRLAHAQIPGRKEGEMTHDALQEHTEVSS